MDSIGDYIWILLALAYFLFGRGKKKEESSQPNAERPTGRTNKKSIEDILRELSGEESKTEKPEPIIPEPQKDRVFPPTRTRQKIDFNDQGAQGAEYSDKREHHAETGNTMQNIRDRMDAASEKSSHEIKYEDVDFDLRQAIINDAVLNRPYK